jgi:hypothetical protein
MEGVVELPPLSIDGRSPEVAASGTNNVINTRNSAQLLSVSLHAFSLPINKRKGQS